MGGQKFLDDNKNYSFGIKCTLYQNGRSTVLNQNGSEKKNLKIYENDRTSELHFGNRKLPEQIISKVIILCLALKILFGIESGKIVRVSKGPFWTPMAGIKLDGPELKWTVRLGEKWTVFDEIGWFKL